MNEPAEEITAWDKGRLRSGVLFDFSPFFGVMNIILLVHEIARR